MNKEKPVVEGQLDPGKKVVKKTTKKTAKKAVKKVVKKAVKKTTKKTIKRTVKRVSKKQQQEIRRSLNPETNKMEVRYNERENTYNGYEITWANIQQFQVMFLEAQYDLSAAEYEELLYEGESFRTVSEQAKRLKEIQRLKAEAIEKLKETYKIVWAIRRQVRRLYIHNDNFRNELDKACREDYVLWINTFAWTFDPRLTNVGLRALLPLVLFPGQVETLSKIDLCYRERRSFLVEKSRAEGLTEILCAYHVWRWLYTPGYKGGWGSRIKTLVDQSGNPDTIFERMRRIIYGLPVAMRPNGWANRMKNNYDNILRISNPDNGSTIIGEGGDNIGRGGRSSFYTIDEAAALEHPQAADEALSYNTNVQGDISTPNGANYFYEKKMSGHVEVITVWWWKNPSKNRAWAQNKRPKFSAWYKKETLTRDPVLIAKEIDVDYHASVGGSIIPVEWVNAAVDFELPLNGQRVAGFDVAGGGKDKSVYALVDGCRVVSCEELRTSTPTEATWQVVDAGERDGISILGYDQNAIGESVYSQITMAEKKVPFKLIGFYGQASASEKFIESEGIRAADKFRNLRAELWWGLRRRFEKTYLHSNGIQFFPLNELISIPNHAQLIAELSAPLEVTTTTGKKGVESKKEMKRRKVKSPDYADAVAYAFGTIEETSASVIGAFDYTDENIVQDIPLNESGATEYYISMVLTEDQRIYLSINIFDKNKQRLDIYHEKTFDEVYPEEVVEYVKVVLGDNAFNSVKGWYGNNRIFEGLFEGKLALWYSFKKIGVSIKQNYRNDYNTSLIMVNKMFKNGKLRVSSKCVRHVEQIRNWKISKGKPKVGFYFCEALAQLVLMLRKRDVIQSPSASNSSLKISRIYGRR